MYSIISVKLDSLLGNTKKQSIDPFVADQCAISPSLGGTCKGTWMIDWVGQWERKRELEKNSDERDEMRREQVVGEREEARWETRDETYREEGGIGDRVRARHKEIHRETRERQWDGECAYAWHTKEWVRERGEREKREREEGENPGIDKATQSTRVLGTPTISFQWKLYYKEDLTILLRLVCVSFFYYTDIRESLCNDRDRA